MLRRQFAKAGNQFLVFAVIAGLAHSGFEMADMNFRISAGVPDQVIPVPSLYSVLPLAAKNCMKLAGKEVRQAINTNRKRDGLQNELRLGLKSSRRIRIDLQLDFEPLVRM